MGSYPKTPSIQIVPTLGSKVYKWWEVLRATGAIFRDP